MPYESKLAKLGLRLPSAVAPVATYVPFCRVGRTVYISGQIPKLDETLYTGHVGENNMDHGKKAAQACALNIMGQIKNACGGDWSKFKRVVQVQGFVACKEDFTQQPTIINGCSDLFVEVFGDKGIHSRFAVGTNALPLGVSVEIAAVVECDE